MEVVVVRERGGPSVQREWHVQRLQGRKEHQVCLRLQVVSLGLGRGEHAVWRAITESLHLFLQTLGWSACPSK